MKYLKGEPGWLSRLSLWLWLRSWSHSSWAQAPHWAGELRAWSLLRILCLPLSLLFPHLCPVSKINRCEKSCFFFKEENAETHKENIIWWQRQEVGDAAGRNARDSWPAPWKKARKESLLVPWALWSKRCPPDSSISDFCERTHLYGFKPPSSWHLVRRPQETNIPGKELRFLLWLFWMPEETPGTLSVCVALFH